MNRKRLTALAARYCCAAAEFDEREIIELARREFILLRFVLCELHSSIHHIGCHREKTLLNQLISRVFRLYGL